MPESLLNEEQLKKWLGYKRRCDIESWLSDRRINWYRAGGGKIVTTQAAIDQAFNTEQAQKVASF